MGTNDYDIIVVGAGHAGCEAGLAAARMGLSVAVFTINRKTIGEMSCNPAVGGTGKSHLVKEIDALGGEMAKVTDMAGIQFKTLNKSKGPAVWATRVQCDRALYRRYMTDALEAQNGLDIKEEVVEEIIVEDDHIHGIRTNNRVYRTRAVIIATGTFLNGLIHIGLQNFPAGRRGEPPSIGLSESLKKLGFRMGRLKTGTPPRLDTKGVDLTVMGVQKGDIPPSPMSIFTDGIKNPQLPCYITYTNPDTHRLILDNLHLSPLYSGRIVGIGPRYCPSIEDKVVRFKERDRHQIFLEPEGIDCDEYYVNGLSTSLPYDIQIQIIRSIKGFENAVIKKPGYAIEYDFVYPTQLKPTLETKSIEGLYLAGQINGTSGYEEAAAQGLVAGINAALKIKKQKPFVLRRDEAYIGVLIDDLITKGTNEPYRIFTSRAEYRLILRQDNADIRLMEKGYMLGLINKRTIDLFHKKMDLIESELKRLRSTRVKPSVINPVLKKLGGTEINDDVPLYQILKRPEVRYVDLPESLKTKDGLTPDMINQIEIQTKYEGYILRQTEMVERFNKIERIKIPEGFVYRGIPGLSREVVEKLEEVMPDNLGQASRIPGITPAAISLLMVAVERSKR